MKFLDDFKAFAMRGNVLDMAVGVIIGSAFGKIVSSLVGDIIMPLLGVLIGGVHFSELKWKMISYGNFLQATFDFLIIAFSIFLFIRLINKITHKKEEAPATPPAPTKEEILLTEIRDLLKEKK